MDIDPSLFSEMELHSSKGTGFDEVKEVRDRCTQDRVGTKL